jgi:hypothetical protein
MKTAIVIVAYNRPHSLKRVLGSIDNAIYRENNIPLVISIDYQDTETHRRVVKIASDFEWKYGNKRVIVHNKKLGLRKHIISCGDLSQEYESIIVLEDDLMVSRNFYKYSSQALAFFRADHSIAGISLYHSNYFEGNIIPFYPIIDGWDNYFMQIPSSWGQIWTKKQLEEFKNFYAVNNKITSDIVMPEYVKQWPESSWKKYFWFYMIAKNKFFVYPVASHSTNMGDIGEHWKVKTSNNQTLLENYHNSYCYRFVSFCESNNLYDSFCELHFDKFKQLKLEMADTELDLYGTKTLKNITKKYLISSRKCIKPIIQYPLLFPNLIDNLTVKNEEYLPFFAFAEKENFADECINPVKRAKLSKMLQPASYMNGLYIGKRYLFSKIPFLKRIIYL